MIYDLKLADKAKCNTKEKESLEPLVHQFQYFSEKARKEGLLALETDLGEIKNPFLRFGLQMMIDGTDPKSVKDILATDIYYSGSHGKNLLEKCIILEGILALFNGENPRLMSCRLGMYLGKIAYGLESNHSEISYIEAYLNTCVNEKPLSEETTILEQLFPQIDDFGIQMMLREIEQSSLAYALSGAGGKAKQQVIQNMSERAALFLIEELEGLGPVAEAVIVENQMKIKEIFLKLREMGEIV